MKTRVIDELRTTVAEKHAAQAERQTELRSQEEYYQREQAPAMRAALDYFRELVDLIKTSEMEVNFRCSLLPDPQEGLELQQGDYVVLYDDLERPKSFEVVCDGHLASQVELYVDGLNAVLDYTGKLEACNFPFHRKNELDSHYSVTGARFILEGPLPAGLRLRAEPGDKRIHLDLLNLESTPRKSYRFGAEKLDSDLLDKLTQILLRRDSQLFFTEKLCFTAANAHTNRLYRTDRDIFEVVHRAQVLNSPACEFKCSRQKILGELVQR